MKLSYLLVVLLFTSVLVSAKDETDKDTSPRTVTAVLDCSTGIQEGCSSTRNMVPARVLDNDQCQAHVRLATCCENEQQSCCSQTACQKTVSACEEHVRRSTCCEAEADTCCTQTACQQQQNQQHLSQLRRHRRHRPRRVEVDLAPIGSLDSQCLPHIRTSTCCSQQEQTCCSACNNQRKLVTADVVSNTECHPLVRAKVCCSKEQQTCCRSC